MCLVIGWFGFRFEKLDFANNPGMPKTASSSTNTQKKKKKKPSSTISTNTIATTTKNLNPTSLAEMPWPPLLPSSGYPSPSLKSESEASTSSQQNLDTRIGRGAQSLPHHVHALPFLQWGKSQAKSSTSYLAHEFHKPIFVGSFFSLHDTLGVLSPLTSSSHLVS